MRKLSLYILSVLLFCNFTNIVNAKVDGEGELYLSEGVVKKFIEYIQKDKDSKPLVFYITLDGTGYAYFSCDKNESCSVDDNYYKKFCKKRNFKNTCKRFAKGRTIKWKNGINPGKGKISKINKKWSDAQIYEKLVELGFINKNKNAKKKISENYVYNNALRRFNSNGDYRLGFEPFHPKDPTTFKNIMFKEKKIFKKRHKKYSGDDIKTFRSFKFLAEFEDNITLEIFIEYNKSKENFEESEEIALFYSKIFGRIPHFLKKHVKKIYIFNSGGNWWVNRDAPNSINISKSNCTNKYIITKGSYTLCNENMIHEAMHLFEFNRKLFSESKWLEARELDKDFYCSEYGTNNITEDFADSVLCWIGVRYKSNKIMKEDVVKINKYIPNRLKFFDDLNLNMHPYKISK